MQYYALFNGKWTNQATLILWLFTYFQRWRRVGQGECQGRKLTWNKIKAECFLWNSTRPNTTGGGAEQKAKTTSLVWCQTSKKNNQKTNKQKQAHRSKWNMILTLFWSFYWPLNDNFFSFISPCLDERFCSTFQLEKNVASNFTLVIYFYPRSSSLHYWNAVRLQCNPKVGIKCMAHSCADTGTISKYTIAIFFIKISFSFFWKKNCQPHCMQNPYVTNIKDEI